MLGGVIAVLSTIVVFVWSLPVILLTAAGLMLVLSVPLWLVHREIGRLDSSEAGDVFG